MTEPLPLAAPVAAPAAAPKLAPGSAAGASPDKIAAVAKQFEAVFLRQMIGSMRQASLGDGLFSSSAEDQFRDMGDAKLADSMAGGAHGGFGIAELLTRQLGGAAAAPGGGSTK